MDVQTQLKAVCFNELLYELHSLHDMYKNFSDNTENPVSHSNFKMISKDLETLLNKFDDKEGILN